MASPCSGNLASTSSHTRGKCSSEGKCARRPSKFLRHLFKWSAAIFTSRCFPSRALGPESGQDWTGYNFNASGQRQAVSLDISRVSPENLDFPVLFPGLDAVNHNHEARVDWAFDPGRFSMSVHDGVEDGAEVFNNYGPKSNDQLLMGYGFCIPNNPHDKVMLTLKAPPSSLQRDLLRVHPYYFTNDSSWSADKATFHLESPAIPPDDPSQIFLQLPEPLLGLLTYILRQERGLPFATMDHPLECLTSRNSTGRRYLPHIARMIVQSLAPKLAKLESIDLPSAPQNAKQKQAFIYRQSQLDILQSLIGALRTYTRSLIYNPSDTTATLPARPCLMTLSSFLSTASLLDDTFLTGIAASANTRDLEQLRLAGWEEDLWVLLLCYLVLKPAKHQLQGMLPEYVHMANTALDPTETEQASSLMDIVHNAAQAYPDSLWSDARWSTKLIAAVGGRMLRYESFTVMCPDTEGGEEARLCMYLHSYQ